MSRPERVKRPRIAADGTILSSTPTQSSSKRARLSAAASASPATPKKQSSKRQTPKKQTPKQRQNSKQLTPEQHTSKQQIAKEQTPQRAADNTAIASRKSPVSATPDEDSELSSAEITPAPTRAEPQATVSKSISQNPSTSALASLESATLERYLPIAKRRVLSVLAGQLPPAGIDKNGRHDGSECVAMDEQWLNLRATVRGTMQGEGNSALLVGARGSGKSMLLESVLRSVDSESGPSKQSYHLVQLDGAIQSTDRLSMRELARQLVKKGAIKVPKEGEEGALDFGIDDEEGLAEEMEGEKADINATEVNAEDGELDGDDERRAVTNAVLSSLANTTSTILTLLSTGGDSNKALPLIITLSSFDLYTSRPRQALLYVLLDAVQAGSYTPGLCVIGMTSRLDTTDLLEKRVRSRFGGRTINIWPEDVWLEVTKNALLAGLADDEYANMSSEEEGKKFAQAWREEVDHVCSDKKVIAMLDEKREVSNVIRTLYSSLYPIVAALSTEEPSLYSAFTQPSTASLSSFSSYSILSDLTVAEFALLIASKQLLNRDREVFNFEMCYDELKRFVSKIEMDRLGAAVAPLTSSSLPSIPNTPDTPSGSGRRRGPANPSSGGFGGAGSGSAMGWQGLTDRNRVMEAFRSLLQLELLQPEANLNTLSLAAAPATTGALATSKGGTLGPLNVRTEYLRVKCTIFPQDIIAAAKSKNRRETLGTHMVQWAVRQG